ncbi:MAG: hypothetical protein K2L71_06655 [Muribaculaceae bacterium]|nr:hypothetical protein [Muribaculaceae bacterium]
MATEQRKLPEEFCRRILTQTPPIPDPQGLLDALSSGSPCVAIRHNRRKSSGQPHPAADAVPWCRLGEYLPERRQFTFDPAFHQGRYYVQDPSSMSIAAVIESLGLTGPVAYLDACAAPGGKTTAAIDALPEGSFVVANEYDSSRAEALIENITRWGATDVAVTVGPTDRLASYGAETFDVIAADVPCSGEGMMRKEARAVEQWTPELVEQCAALQREIIGNLWPMLRPGGYLIYSTCTFSPQENEENVEWICNRFGARRMPLPFSLTEGVADGHFYPHLVRGEGLFMALLRKPGESLPPDPTINEKKLRKATRVAIYGVERTEAKGRDMIPTHRAVLATDWQRGSLPEAEVDTDTALAFLHRDAITLPDTTPRGLVVLTYGGLPLGLVKNIGTRANNLLPKQHRILSRLH